MRKQQQTVNAKYVFRVRVLTFLFGSVRQAMNCKRTGTRCPDDP